MDRGQRRVPEREQELKRTVHAPRRRVPFAGPVLLFLLLVSGSSTPPRQHIADAVRRFLAGRPDSPIVIDGLITASPAQLRLFYGERRYEPVWMTEGGRALIPRLVHAIRHAIRRPTRRARPSARPSAGRPHRGSGRTAG